MGSLLVEDENIKVSKSSFSIYKNEKVKYEGKDISRKLFAYRLQSGYFQPKDIEILNAVYKLKFCTSRQICMFLNYIRNIDINQNVVTKRLTALNNSDAIVRYSFISDERDSETGLKCYVLKENGKWLLKNRHYDCNFNTFHVSQLDEIKKYLSINQYLLKILQLDLIEYEKINYKDYIRVGAFSYSIENEKHIITSIRRNNNTIDSIKNILTELINGEECGYKQNRKYIIIGEDDIHLFDIFKKLLILAQKKVIDIKLMDSIIFTNDLRILERELSSCFIKFNIKNQTVVLEDLRLAELKVIKGKN